MAKKKVPTEFTKAPPPETLPPHLMYVKIEAVIPIDREDDSGSREYIKESIDMSMDVMANYGQGFITSCYEIEDAMDDACEILRQRRLSADISGEE